MFDPVNKTISQLREEVAGHIGKKVTVTGGREVTIESVSECSDVIIPKDNDWDNWDADEHGLHYKGDGKKMYGFTAIVFYMEAGFGSDKKYTYPERIIVPLEIKNKKINGNVQSMIHKNNQISILK